MIQGTPLLQEMGLLSEYFLQNITFIEVFLLQIFKYLQTLFLCCVLLVFLFCPQLKDILEITCHYILVILTKRAHDDMSCLFCSARNNGFPRYDNISTVISFIHIYLVKYNGFFAQDSFHFVYFFISNLKKI